MKSLQARFQSQEKLHRLSRDPEAKYDLLRRGLGYFLELCALKEAFQFGEGFFEVRFGDGHGGDSFPGFWITRREEFFEVSFGGGFGEGDCVAFCAARAARGRREPTKPEKVKPERSCTCSRREELGWWGHHRWGLFRWCRLFFRQREGALEGWVREEFVRAQ